MSYTLESDVDETSIEFSYLLMLGRAPESHDAVRRALSPARSVGQLRLDVIASPEYQDGLREQTRSRMVGQYLRCKREQMSTGRALTPNSDIILLQTSDDVRYSRLLEASSRFNKAYAQAHQLEYTQYVGVKRGAYPHHAMFNRVHLLNELVDSEFAGWVLYLDADAIVKRPDFDIRGHLEKLRSEGMCMSLHSVYSTDHPLYTWWGINDGCFAVDLSSLKARSVVKAWAGIYLDLYTQDDFLAATEWMGWILDDQHALWLVLQELDMERSVHLGDLQGDSGFAHQFLRSDALNISADHELERRRAEILRVGCAIYELEEPS